jgi:hypothetical protein
LRSDKQTASRGESKERATAVDSRANAFRLFSESLVTKDSLSVCRIDLRRGGGFISRSLIRLGLFMTLQIFVEFAAYLQPEQAKSIRRPDRDNELMSKLDAKNLNHIEFHKRRLRKQN